MYQFYKNLSDARNIEESVTTGRKCIDRRGSIITKVSLQ